MADKGYEDLDAREVVSQNWKERMQTSITIHLPNWIIEIGTIIFFCHLISINIVIIISNVDNVFIPGARVVQNGKGPHALQMVAGKKS